MMLETMHPHNFSLFLLFFVAASFVWRIVHVFLSFIKIFPELFMILLVITIGISILLIKIIRIMCPHIHRVFIIFIQMESPPTSYFVQAKVIYSEERGSVVNLSKRRRKPRRIYPWRVSGNRHDGVQ